jgi:hypothetical protein
VVRIRRRIELLEETLLPVDQGPPELFHIDFVDADRKVVNTLVLTSSLEPEKTAWVKDSWTNRKRRRAGTRRRDGNRRGWL